MKIPPRLEELQPFIGPCLICGGPDKRHRLWDAIRDGLSAGMGMADVCDNWVVTEEEVRLIVSLPTRRKRFRELQGVA